MRKELAVLAVLASASAAWADGIIYDGFNYSATGSPFLGSGPSGAAGPAGAWVFQGNNVVETQVVSGSLNYTGMTSYGNSVQLDNHNGVQSGAGAAAARLYIGDIEKATTPTVYYSMMLSLPAYTLA